MPRRADLLVRNRQLKVLDRTAKNLLSRGVSFPALRTTLVNEGREDIRNFIQQKQYLIDYGAVRPVVFCSAHCSSNEQRINNAGYCDLLFNLFLKELILSGHDSCMTSIREIRRVIIANPEVLPVSRLLHLSKPFAFYPDFYPLITHSDRYPKEPWVLEDVEAHILESYYEHNVGPVIQSCVPLSKIEKDWSPKLLGIVSKDAIIFEITAPKEKGR